MRRLDLPPQLIQSFLTVLRMQSYTKAAQALSLTQPAISQHVSRLEEILGFSLIERSRGAILPTPKAQALLPDLERVEHTLQLMFEKARAVAHEGQHVVRIATTTSFVAHLLGPVVANHQANGNRLYPVFHEVDDYRVYDMVRAGEVDFALTSMEGSDAELSRTPLFRDRPCLVYPAGHRLSGNGVVGLEDVFPSPLIRPPSNTAAKRMIEIFEQEYGREFTFVGEASRSLTMEAMVRCGLGLLILPALSAHLIGRSGLGFRPLDTESAWRRCQLIRPQRTRPAPLVQALVDGVVEQAHRLHEEMPELVIR